MTIYTDVSTPQTPEQLAFSFPSEQDWTAYNNAQCSEKDNFVQLLTDLCALL